MSNPVNIDVVPEEFSKVIGDFVTDINRSFPEYTPLISKWWKTDDQFSHIENEEEREKQITQHKEARVTFLYKFSMKKYPPRFFEILNQDVAIFSDESEVDTEFLPFIHFKNIWQDDISAGTRETIWKYLQLILFSVVNSVRDREAFGDTAKLFENMDEEDFKSKLDNALDEIKGIFENKQGDDASIPQPNVDNIHSHLSGMFTGKLGDLAREIAEETAGDLNIEENGETDVKEVFNNMFKNPGKLMGLVQNVGSKLEDKMKSGDISEAELMREASEMLTKMKNVPGMGDIQSMMSNLGMNLGGAKMDMKGMEARMKQEMKKEQTREHVRKQGEKMRMEREMEARMREQTQRNTTPKYTDEELVAMFGSSGNTGSDTKKKSGKNKNNKNKNKKNKKEKETIIEHSSPQMESMSA